MNNKRIFLIGHYGGNNLGDELMLGGILDYLGSTYSPKKIFVVSKIKSDLEVQNIELISLSVKSVLKATLLSDFLVLGGGTHFHDDYTQERYSKHVLYLFKILALSICFFLLKKKVHFVGMGFGPFNRKSIKIITKFCLLFVNHVTVRDEESKRRLGLLGIPIKKIKSRFDLAALNPLFAKKTNYKKSNTLGISLTSLSFSGMDNGDYFWDNTVIPDLFSLYSNSNINIYIFVFRVGNKESDLLLSTRLYEKLCSFDTHRVKLITPENQEIFISLVNICEFFVATRYHSAVSAYLLGCRILTIPYHAKLTDFSRLVGLSQASICDTSKPHTFRNMVDELCNNSDDFLPKLDIGDAIKSARKNFHFVNG
jgi:polysaccharide pyruvyl transferase WcaK-like protein